MERAEQARLEKVTGIVFDIQRYSLDDGPGLRTSVFLKGCPLQCAWCSNPESRRPQPELLMFETNCILCGACVDACTVKCRSLEDGRLQWDRACCTGCGDCARVCPAGATLWSGDFKTAGEVVREVLRDALFYESGGGMTLTGGEPLLQRSFAEALLRLAKAEALNTAVETSLHAPWKTIDALRPYVNLWMVDLKHMDSRAHRRWTGAGNERIHANLKKLAAGSAPICVRVPLIPQVNSSEDNLRRTAEFVIQLGASVRCVDLLPFHKLARAKYRALDMASKFYDADPLPEYELQAAAELLRSYKLTVAIPGRATSKEAL